MPAYFDKGARHWRYRKAFTRNDGTKVRISGTPEINTRAGAEAAELQHATRVINGEQPHIGRPPAAGEAREIQIKVLGTHDEKRRWAAIAKEHGCSSIPEAMRLAMELLGKERA
jgi:hypothetical protein